MVSIINFKILLQGLKGGHPWSPRALSVLVLTRGSIVSLPGALTILAWIAKTCYGAQESWSPALLDMESWSPSLCTAAALSPQKGRLYIGYGALNLNSFGTRLFG